MYRKCLAQSKHSINSSYTIIVQGNVQIIIKAVSLRNEMLNHYSGYERMRMISQDD